MAQNGWDVHTNPQPGYGNDQTGHTAQVQSHNPGVTQFYSPHAGVNGSQYGNVQQFTPHSPILTPNGQNSQSAQSFQANQALNRAPAQYSLDAYVTLDHRLHALRNPDMTVGTARPVKRELWVYDYTVGAMALRTISVPPAMEACYRELIANAADNASRTRRAGRDPGGIDITMNETTISVKNYGDAIPLGMVETDKGLMPNPQKIFSIFLTSSTFEGDRHDAGKNGIGAKAANIFSSRFTVEVCNAVVGQKYTQTWRDNMGVCEPPVIEAYQLSYNSCTVTFTIDFAYFNYVPAYTDEFCMLYMRHAMDASFNTEVPVTFNGQAYNFDLEHFRDFARLYFGAAVETSLIHYEWTTPAQAAAAAQAALEAPGANHGASGTSGASRKPRGKAAQAAAAVADLAAQNPHVQQCRIKLLVCDTPNNGRRVSYVNCIMTNDGGTHVDAALEAFGTPIVDKVNATFLERHGAGKSKIKKGKGAKAGKGKNKGAPKSISKAPVKTNPAPGLTAAEKKAFTIGLPELARHISFLVSVRVINPDFDSQTKTKLTYPPVAVTMEPRELKQCDNWQLIHQLVRDLQAKQARATEKLDGGHSAHGVLKGVKANWAGTAKRDLCILAVTEGETGQGFSSIALSGNRDRGGQLALRGKIPTASKSDLFKIEKNTELSALKTMLGLKYETNYLDEAAYATLNYGGGLLIMTDADPDGDHIKGLLVDYFAIHFPTLLMRGYLMYWASPIRSVKRGKGDPIFFYTPDEFTTWQTATADADSRAWKHKYYKGLGSSESREIKMQMRAPRVIHCIYDDRCPEAVKLAFDPGMVEARKQWLLRCVPQEGVDHVRYMTITQALADTTFTIAERNVMYKIEQMFAIPVIMSEFYTDFFNDKFLRFSLMSVLRAIPASDGLKISQRKIIAAVLHHWPHGSRGEDIKVAQLAGIVAQLTHYPHGEKNLEETITKLARTFTGTNNANMLRPMGMFGNNMDGADGASPGRYIFTKPTGFLHLLMHKDDMPLLDYIYDNGKRTPEPRRFYPVAPLHMLNPIKGVATGWATQAPAYNPLDIFAWLQQRLSGVPLEQIPDPIPWYRYAACTFVLINRAQKSANRVKMTRACRGMVETGMFVDINDDADEDGVRQTHSLISYGNFYHDSRTGHLVVDALPLGICGLEYKNFLEGLKADKFLRDYDLQSDTDDRGRDTNIFYLKGYSGVCDHKTLGLVRTMSLANMYLLDEHDTPIRYNSAADMLESYYIERLPVYARRKAHMLAEMDKTMVTLSNRARFIQAILDKQLRVKNRPKADVIANMVTLLDFSEEVARKLYTDARIANLSREDVLELQAEIVALQEKHAALVAKDIKQLWWEDLNDLVQYIVRKPRRFADFNYNRRLDAQAYMTRQHHESAFVQGFNQGSEILAANMAAALSQAPVPPSVPHQSTTKTTNSSGTVAPIRYQYTVDPWLDTLAQGGAVPSGQQSAAWASASTAVPDMIPNHGQHSTLLNALASWQGANLSPASSGTNLTTGTATGQGWGNFISSSDSTTSSSHGWVATASKVN